MDSRLSAGSENGAHGADHEVLEEQVRVGAVIAGVLAEVGDLAAPGLALERAGVGSAAGGIASGGCAQAPGGGGGQARVGRGPGDASREGAGRNREGRHLCERKKRKKKRDEREI